MNEFLRKLKKSNHFKCSTNKEESSNEHRRGENLTISNTVNQEYQIASLFQLLSKFYFVTSRPAHIISPHAGLTIKKFEHQG